MSDDRKHVIVMSHGDRSGIRAVFGPYDDAKAANVALGEMSDWPFAEETREVMPLLPFAVDTKPKTVCRGGS